MSGPTKSRQKHKLEPISIEELAGTTGMSGFCSFLTRDASVSVPVLDKMLESGAPDSNAEAAVETHEATPPAFGTTDAEAENLGPSGLADRGGAEAFSDMEAFGQAGRPVLLPDYRLPRRIRIREAMTVEDGHSLGEQAVYEAMYEVARPGPVAGTRILTIGLRTLAELSRMAYSNCKTNVRALVAKRAIDESTAFSYTDGRTYVIYSPEEILRRRRASGMTHVVRNRGVIYVDPASGRPLAGVGDSG